MESIVMEKRAHSLKTSMNEITNHINNPTHPALRRPEIVERGALYSAFRTLVARFGDIEKQNPRGFGKEITKFQYDPKIFTRDQLEEVKREVNETIRRMAQETGKNPQVLMREYIRHLDEYREAKDYV